MTSLRRFLLRLRDTVARDRADESLQRELSAHLALLEDDHRRRGLSPEEARHAARRAMGGVEQAREQHRDSRSFAWIDDLRRDVRHAGRTIARNPVFSALVIVTLGLGIGATTAVYSAFDAALLRPLPFRDPEQLVRLSGVGLPLDLHEFHSASGRAGGPLKSSPDLGDLDSLRDIFTRTAAHATGAANLGSGLEPLRVNITYVTSGFFATIGRGPALGRAFVAGEAQDGSRRVTVLSDRVWRTHFGGEASIVGRNVLVDAVPHEVVGVMPPDFRFPAQADLWVPLAVPVPPAVMSSFRNFFPGEVVARLAPGVTARAAAERLDVMRRQYSRPASHAWSAVTSLAVPLQQSLVANRRTTLRVLMASAALLPLMACANAATLLLSRADGRRHEMAAHAVLGATRGRLLRRLLIETFVLAGAGALVGIGLAAASQPLLSALLPPALTGLAPLQVDGRVLGFTIAIAVLTAVAFGLWPAIGLSRTEFADALRASSTREVTATTRINRLLVVVQVAIACVLTAGALLLGGSLRALLATELGMRIDQVAAGRVNLPDAAYGDVPARATFTRSVVERLQQMPGVASAAAINTLPLAGEVFIALRVDPEGAPPPEAIDMSRAAPYLVVSPGYFDTMGIPLLRGRDVRWSDSASEAVAVVNERLARRFWPNEEALGKRFGFGGPPLYTIVGVIADARVGEVSGEIAPQVYLPIQNQPQNYVSFVARAEIAAAVPPLADAIGRAVRDTDSTIPVFAAQPMSAVIAGTLAPRRTNTWLIGLFGTLALGLAAIGVYGVLACAVARRSREIGVRMALGAKRGDVLSLIVRQGLVLLTAGLVVGLGAAAGTTRYLEGMLYAVTPRDPWTFGAVAVLLLVVGTVAALLPAHRAASTDPLAVLRSE